MKGKRSFNCNYAVSEIVGGMILVLIAALVFSLIYVYFLYPEPDVRATVTIEGYVDDYGDIVLEHVGGSPVNLYKIKVWQPNGDFIGSKTISNDTWDIGEEIKPLDGITDIKLENETFSLTVWVFKIETDGDEKTIFQSVIFGNPDGIGDDAVILEDPMILTSLKTNSVDEDIICYKDTIDAPPETETYIYNWIVDGDPISYLIMPFDSENDSYTRDYSRNLANGSIEINSASWTPDGKVGGAYSFDGDDDNIFIPYCFDDGGYINEMTIELWIKTAVEKQIIAHFGGGDLWELSLNDGYVKILTNSTDGDDELQGSEYVSDDQWHLITVTYAYSTGYCSIYVDGELDNTKQSHSIWTPLGNGDTPDGYIGLSHSSGLEQTWDVLTYDNFESGYGNFEDGGDRCRRQDYYSYQGSYSVRLSDQWNEHSSTYYDDSVDIHTPGYTSLKIDFWWMWRDYYIRHHPGWSSGEDWWLYYYDGGGWERLIDMNYPSVYSEDVWYHKILYVNETEYSFPTNMYLWFQCDAGYYNDEVYFDEIYVNATTVQSSLANFTGIIDEFRIYNRSLSPEQVYQNYICTQAGLSDRSVIVSEESALGNLWSCIVTLNDELVDIGSITSPEILIISYSGGG